jgi:hypothetical protein
MKLKLFTTITTALLLAGCSKQTPAGDEAALRAALALSPAITNADDRATYDASVYVNLSRLTLNQLGITNLSPQRILLEAMILADLDHATNAIH